MNYERIKRAAKEKKIAVRNLCAKINLSEAGFYETIKNDTLKVRDLEKIAITLDVPIVYFFDEMVEMSSIEIKNNHTVIGEHNGHIYNSENKENIETQLYKERIKSLEEQIILLKDTIEILKNK